MSRRKPTPPEQKRRYNYRYRYGITVEQYERQLRRQKGVCAICSQPPPPGKRLHVDHDHGSGQVRELLCINCNRGIGIMETPEWFANALDYLKRHHPERYID